MKTCFPRLHSRWKTIHLAGGVVFTCFPQRVHSVFGCFLQPLCRLVLSNGHEKAPVGGLEDVDGAVLEAHDIGNGVEIGIEVGVEGGVVVADGAVGILEAVAGQNANHR